MNLRRAADCIRLNGRVASLLVRGRWIGAPDIARSYDRLARDYDRAWLVHLQETTARLLGDLPDRLPEGDLLDLGCGTGFAARRLMARYPDRRIAACDASAGMISTAQSHPDSASINWTVADMLTFLAACPPDSAALIVAAWSVGYTDYRRAFRHCRRALCAGGRLACVVNLADTLGPLRRAFRYCMQAHASELQKLARFPFPRSAAALRAALESAGLTVETLTEGHCPIQPPDSPDGRTLPWLLRTGTLAGFDAMLPLDSPGPVADTFELRLALDPEPIRHHYVSAVAVRP